MGDLTYLSPRMTSSNGEEVISLGAFPWVSDQHTTAENIPEEIAPAENTPGLNVPSEGLPSESMPQGSTPQESTPQESAPQESAPQESTPQESAPQESTPQESTPQESTPQESTPQESTPQESTPQESTPQESAPQESSPQESSPQEGASKENASVAAVTVQEDRGGLTQWLTQPEAGGISCGGWAGIGLLAGLLAAGAAVAVSTWLRRRKVDKAVPEVSEPWNGSITVDKLHEQGARTGQQDCFFVSPVEEGGNLLAVVADGMGGLADGDKVSQTAVSAMAQAFYCVRGTPQQVLLQLAAQANRAVNDLLGVEGAYRSGSTLTAGLIRDGAFHYLSIGDSRIALYRKGVLYQLNREHIYRNELYIGYVNGSETLEGAVSHPKAAGLTSFLGMGELKYIDLPAEPVAVQPGDQFILMSDGVYNALSPQELQQALSQGPGQAAQALDSAIKAKGYQNQDNYTAVILNC